MNMKMNSRPPGSRIQQRNKPKSNKKKLFLIFLGSFLGFFFLCTFIASILTPTIDVPALKNDGNLDTLSSEDFKGRIDPRLKSIELQEDSAPVTTDPGAVADKENAIGNMTQENTTVELPNTEANPTDIQDSDAEFKDMDQIPYDNTGEDSSPNSEPGNNPKASTPKEPNPFQPQPNKIQQPSKPSTKVPMTKPATPARPNNLMLRDKINVEKEPVSMSKVMVGGFSTPAEARRASEELTNSNLNVTPFIKESNGSYSLQVGSFSNQRKAESLASELKKRNLQPKIVSD